MLLLLSCFFSWSPRDWLCAPTLLAWLAHKTRMEHPIQPSVSLCFCLASSLQADAGLIWSLCGCSARMLHTLHMLLADISSPALHRTAVGSLFLFFSEDTQCNRLTHQHVAQRSEGWLLRVWIKTLGTEEMSCFCLYFGTMCEHLQTVNPCFAWPQLLI